MGPRTLLSRSHTAQSGLGVTGAVRRVLGRLLAEAAAERGQEAGVDKKQEGEDVQ